jgi:hypothetical protein
MPEWRRLWRFQSVAWFSDNHYWRLIGWGGKVFPAPAPQVAGFLFFRAHVELP